MREIEFRIRYGNEWYYGIPLSKIDNIGTIAFKSFDDSYYDLFADATTFGQYTGLKDKNGKKIFEWDILEFDFYDIGKQRAFVYWNEKYCAFLLNVISNNFEFAKISDGKVIGNIYENPELLKGE